MPIVGKMGERSKMNLEKAMMPLLQETLSL